MMQRISSLLILISIFFSSCGLNTRGAKEYKEEKVSILRYDKLLSEYVRSNSFSALQKLTMDYRQPTKILIEDVLSIGTVGDDTISQRLQNFYSDTTLIRLLNDVEQKFPDLDAVEKGLTKGFLNLKREVPSIKVPLVYSQVSAFNESIVVVDSLLGISLDKYMGEDYPLYKRFYYDYQCRSMRPECIVPDCFVFYLLSCYEISYDAETSLIDLMLHYGKINYVVQKILDYGSVGKVMGYSEEEINWCKANEKAIWKYICSNNHQHARDPMIIRHYMKPAPSIQILEEQAPTLIGIWMGSQIVSSFMKKHSEMKLKDLLVFTDYHRMLDESGY